MPNYKKSIPELPFFSELAPALKIEKYGRDGGPEEPRRRLEIRPGLPSAFVRKLLSTRVGCCSCGRPIHPFRARKAPPKRGDIPRHIYLAVSCTLADDKGCSRGAAARQAYLDIEEAWHVWNQTTIKESKAMPEKKRKIIQISINPHGGALALSDDGKVWMARGDYWQEIWPDSERLDSLQAESSKKKLDSCEMTVRAKNLCINLGLVTLGDLAAVKEQVLLRQKNTGRKTLKELRELLQKNGLHFRNL